MASNWIMPSDADEGAGMPSMPKMPNLFGFSGPSTTGGQMAVEQQNQNIKQSQTAQLAKKYNVTPLTPPPTTPQAQSEQNKMEGWGAIGEAVNPFSSAGFDIGKRFQSLDQGINKLGDNVFQGIANTPLTSGTPNATLGKFLPSTYNFAVKSAGDVWNSGGNVLKGIGDFADAGGKRAESDRLLALSRDPKLSQEQRAKLQLQAQDLLVSSGEKNDAGLRNTLQKGLLGMVSGAAGVIGSPVVGAMDVATDQGQKEWMAGVAGGVNDIADQALDKIGLRKGSAEADITKASLLAALDVLGLKGVGKGVKGIKNMANSTLLNKADDVFTRGKSTFTNAAEDFATKYNVKSGISLIADKAARSGVKIPDINVGKFTPARAKDPIKLAQSALTGKVKPVVNTLVGMGDDNTKRFVRVNTELVRNAPREIKGVMKELQDAAKKMANGQAVPSPKEIVGSRATAAAEALLAQRQNAGGKIGDLIKGNKTPINVKSFSDDLLSRLKTDRVQLAPDGIDFSMSKYADDVAAKSVVERVFRFVADKQDAKGVTTFIPEDIQILRDQIRALKPAPGITSSAGNLINTIDKQLKGLLTDNVAGYAPIAKKYAETTKSLDGFAKLLGKQADDITTADVRAGEIANRLLGAASDRPMRVFQSLLDDAAKYGAKTGTYKDFEKLVKYSDFLEDIYPGIVAPRGFEGGIAQGVKRGLTGGKAGVVDKVLEGTLKYTFGDNEKAVRQYFEALVDQAAGKQVSKVTKTGATVTGQKELIKQAATGATKGTTKGKLSALTKKGAKTGVNVAGAAQGTNPQQ